MGFQCNPCLSAKISNPTYTLFIYININIYIYIYIAFSKPHMIYHFVLFLILYWSLTFTPNVNLVSNVLNVSV